MSHFGAKKSFFKLFTFTYSAQSPWFIIWILRTWGTKFLGPIRDKKCPILRPKRVLSRYPLLSPLITYSALSLCKAKLKKSSAWLPKKKCTKFWAKSGVKLSHVSAKKRFYKLLMIGTFVSLHYPITVKNFKKKKKKIE